MMRAMTRYVALLLRSLSARVWSDPELGVAGPEGMLQVVTLARC